MTRIPLVPTLLVALAVAAMLALGCWQLLDRLPKKQAFLAQLAANPARPEMALPAAPDERLLFRRARATCLPPVRIDVAGAGAAGFRLIARCRPGAAGPGLAVQLGTSRDPLKTVAWSGGPVAGFIGRAPDSRSLIGSLFDRRPGALLLVADPPLAGLAANGRPDAAGIPNNHLAYAVQWFVFAGLAALIYGLALRRRVGAS